MKGAEDELGRLDARASDGDHGAAMSRGSQGPPKRRAPRPAPGPARLRDLPLRAWSGAFADDRPIATGDVAKGAADALAAVKRLGAAKIGDKTLVDAFEPFVVALTRNIDAGDSLNSAWRDAAEVAVPPPPSLPP
jgi:dihydroxyacetone kinase